MKPCSNFVLVIRLQACNFFDVGIEVVVGRADSGLIGCRQRDLVNRCTGGNYVVSPGQTFCISS